MRKEDLLPLITIGGLVVGVGGIGTCGPIGQIINNIRGIQTDVGSLREDIGEVRGEVDILSTRASRMDTVLAEEWATPQGTPEPDS